jgi:WXG100 family type VII secretion target
MAVIGGELEQLAALRGVFDTQAGAVDDLTRTIRAQLDGTSWQGPAADRFRQAWEGEFEPNLAKLRTALQDAATEVARRRDALIQAGS